MSADTEAGGGAEAGADGSLAAWFSMRMRQWLLRQRALFACGLLLLFLNVLVYASWLDWTTGNALPPVGRLLGIQQFALWYFYLLVVLEYALGIFLACSLLSYCGPPLELLGNQSDRAFHRAVLRQRIRAALAAAGPLLGSIGIVNLLYFSLIRRLDAADMFSGLLFPLLSMLWMLLMASLLPVLMSFRLPDLDVMRSMLLCLMHLTAQYCLVFFLVPALVVPGLLTAFSHEAERISQYYQLAAMAALLLWVILALLPKPVQFPGNLADS